MGSGALLGDLRKSIYTACTEDHVRSALGNSDWLDGVLFTRWDVACLCEQNSGGLQHFSISILLPQYVTQTLTAPIPALAPVMSTVLPTRREALKTDILRDAMAFPRTCLCIASGRGRKGSRAMTGKCYRSAGARMCPSLSSTNPRAASHRALFFRHLSADCRLTRGPWLRDRRARLARSG